MKKAVFLSELKNALMIEEETINETTGVHLTSLTTLSVIAFIDEFFNKQVDAAALKRIESIADLIVLIGAEDID
jgi:acyl carrier protein